MKYRFLIAVSTCFLLNGCFESKPVSVASIGNAGSLGGPHFIRDMWVSDIYGGGANFAYGSVQGCCASASIGIGIPSAIKGEWENGVGGGSSRESGKSVGSQNGVISMRVMILNGFELMM